jgi:hypothetical protein
MASAEFFDTVLLTVQTLMVIKDLLKDPHGVFKSRDMNFVDPCRWDMVTCSTDSFITGL